MPESLKISVSCPQDSNNKAYSTPKMHIMLLEIIQISNLEKLENLPHCTTFTFYSKLKQLEKGLNIGTCNRVPVMILVLFLTLLLSYFFQGLRSYYGIRIWVPKGLAEQKYEIRNTADGNRRNLGADSNYIFIIVS